MPKKRKQTKQRSNTDSHDKSNQLKKKKKSKQLFTVYTIPKNNSNQYKKKLNLSIKQIGFWKERILNEMNINLVKLASSKKSRNKNDLSDRDSIIQNIIVNEIGNNVEVRKYDDDNDNIQVLSQLEIFDYVKMKFTRKISELKKKFESKELQQNIKLSSCTLRGVKVPNISTSSLPPKSSMNSIPRFENFHLDQNEHPTARNIKWPMYSMIHGLFESFDFVLYNGSHRVINNEIVHYNSRVVLKFPERVNMFIIFHGNLIHCGAASKYLSYKYSMNYGQDLRAFAYVDKFGKKKLLKQTGMVTRNSFGSDDVERRDTHEDTITTTTYKACSKMKNVNSKCDICDKYVNKELTTNGYCIDLMKEYDNYLTKNKSGSEYLEPICGNLDLYGWAVYEGLDTKNHNIVGSLFQDCRDLIYRPRSLTGITWNQIQNAPKPEIGSGRYQLKISNDFLNGNENIYGKYLKSVIQFYKMFESECLNKIKSFEMSEIKEGHLLRNEGNLFEQKEHKDYEPTSV